MTIDLENLTPEPWFVRPHNIIEDTLPSHYCIPVSGPDHTSPAHCYGGQGRQANAHFIAVARTAFGVMMRRGWFVSRGPDGKWYARAAELPTISELAFNDPYSALVGAEKWYVANVGVKPS